MNLSCWRIKRGEEKTKLFSHCFIVDHSLTLRRRRRRKIHRRKRMSSSNSVPLFHSLVFFSFFILLHLFLSIVCVFLLILYFYSLPFYPTFHLILKRTRGRDKDATFSLHSLFLFFSSFIFYLNSTHSNRY